MITSEKNDNLESLMKKIKSGKDLNEKFINGIFICLEDMDFSNIVGAHQEIEYKF